MTCKDRQFPEESERTVNTSRPADTEDHRRRRYILLGLSVILIAAAAYFGPALRDREPDYYDPARATLVNAKRLFEESLVHEQVLVSNLQMAREELDAAITQLGKVATLDPAHRSAVESLRAKLLSIENPDHPGATSPEELKLLYRDLLLQMDTLIEDMDSHPEPAR